MLLENMPPDMPPAKESSREGLSRRRLLKATGTVAVGATIAEVTRRLGFWNIADLGIGEIAALERKLLEERKNFAEGYLEDAEGNIDTEEAMRLFVLTELARYLRSNPSQGKVNANTFEADLYRPFMDAVGQKFDEKQKVPPEKKGKDPDTAVFKTPSVTAIANAKLALYEQLGEKPHYWGKKNNIIDPMVSSDLQCRSGSKLLLLVILEKMESQLQPGEKLVSIHTNHHIQMGLLTADGRVIAFEMTKSGKGIQDLGPLKDIQTPILITDAKHELAQAAINQQAHREKTVLLENVPEGYTGFDKVFDVKNPFGGGGIGMKGFSFGVGGGAEATTDQYGFGNGKVDIPKERIPITSMDYVPSSFTTSRQGNGGNSIYDTVRDTERTHRQLWESMNAEERSALQEFEQHSPIFSRHMHAIARSYEMILDGEGNVDVRAELKIIIENTRALIRYMDQNDLDTKYDAYEQALNQYHKRTGKDVSFPRNPREYAISVLEDLKRHSRR